MSPQPGARTPRYRPRATSRSRSTSGGARPSPAVTAVPTRFRTIALRKPCPSITTARSGAQVAVRTSARVTVRNLEVVEVDVEENVLVVKGAVPGPNGGYVVVRRAKR